MESKKAQTDLDSFIARLAIAAEEPAVPPWVNADEYGISAVQPIANLLAHPDMEARRNAKRALYVLARYASHPQRARFRRSLQDELLRCLARASSEAKREILWVLSEVADSAAVPPIAGLLTDPELREDARCVLMRIPGKRSVSALEAAHKKSGGAFKEALAHAVRTLNAEL